jgi:hypothetical protein
MKPNAPFPSPRSAADCPSGFLVRTALVIALIAATTGPALADPAAEGRPRPRVFPDAESVQPLEVGASIPSADVRTIDGQTIDVATLTRERGALLVFYRGGW